MSGEATIDTVNAAPVPIELGYVRLSEEKLEVAVPEHIQNLKHVLDFDWWIHVRGKHAVIAMVVATVLLTLARADFPPNVPFATTTFWGLLSMGIGIRYSQRPVTPPNPIFASAMMVLALTPLMVAVHSLFGDVNIAEIFQSAVFVTVTIFVANRAASWVLPKRLHERSLSGKPMRLSNVSVESARALADRVTTAERHLWIGEFEFTETGFIGSQWTAVLLDDLIILKRRRNGQILFASPSGISVLNRKHSERSRRCVVELRILGTKISALMPLPTLQKIAAFAAKEPAPATPFGNRL